MAASAPLTEKQQKVLDMITANIDRGCPPTLQEIADHFRLGISTVQDHVAALETKGVLVRQKDKARSFRIVGRSEPTAQVRLPLLGRVPAGVPIEAEENIEEHLVLDKSLVGQANYLLRVQGDSMAPEIKDGDLALIRKVPIADDGDVVIAMVENDGATVKRLRRKGRDAWLEPENPKYRPIRGRPFQVVGKLLGIMRNFRSR